MNEVTAQSYPPWGDYHLAALSLIFLSKQGGGGQEENRSKEIYCETSPGAAARRDPSKSGVCRGQSEGNGSRDGKQEGER